MLSWFRAWISLLHGQVIDPEDAPVLNVEAVHVSRN
jgi:hypothetical protein